MQLNMDQLMALAESGEGGDQSMLTQIPNNIFFQKALRRKPGQKTEALGQYLLRTPLKIARDNEAEYAWS